ncbi:MAG TPA: hypothetical protein VMT34_14815 [Aggregatilineales bacterium]|nr:hypothetical protein [Aggregatilineales bacterium]
MSIFATLAQIFNNAYILFCLALGLWAGIVAFRGGALGGQFWGAMWTCTLMAVASLGFWAGRALNHEELRPVYLLYELFFVVVLPGTFALLRGRDDRVAAAIFAGIAIFAALSAISAADPSRGVITPHPTPNPTPSSFLWMDL